MAETTELPAPIPAPPELLRGETIPEPTMAGMGLLAVAENPLLMLVTYSVEFMVVGIVVLFVGNLLLVYCCF